MNRLFAIAIAVLLVSACTSFEKLANKETASSISSTKVEKPFPFAPPSARIEQRKNGPSKIELEAPTQVVILGTGTPLPDAYRGGSSIAVIHRGEAYLFDAGAGAVRRAAEARYKYNIPSLYPMHIKAAFITHMHSDHVMDLSELSQTLWWRRPEKLRAFGPKGLKGMTDSMAMMNAVDAQTRNNSVQPVLDPEGYKINTTEIEPGIVFETEGISVEAFPVPHGDITPAFGYKIITHDMTIVISGDTAASDIIREKAQGADILFHEAISGKGFEGLSEFWQNYHIAAHTLAREVGKIAAVAKPKKLVLYHTIHYGEEEHHVVNEAAQEFDGEVVLANDLDIFSSNDFND